MARPPSSRLPSDSLALALLGAAQAVATVGEGIALPQALARVFEGGAYTAQTRGAIQDIAYRTLRRLGRARALLAQLTRKPPEPPVLGGLLCCAIALIEENAQASPYAPFTVVDQAVDAAAARRDTMPAKGMVNAVLRRLLRERDTLSAHLAKDEIAVWNYPSWWIDAVRDAYPAAWQAILETGNRQPPLTLRVNRRRMTAPDYLALLKSHGMEADLIGPSAIRLARALPVQQIPGFADGVVSVQDAAAQLAAPVLDVQDGMRVLDACAAPGGKTGHLLETADLDLTALDADAERTKRIEDNLRRLQLQAGIRQGDARLRDWWDGRLFDRILADVPCTASGIVRRHPDIRWLRRPDDVDRLATLSAEILDNLWQLLRPDGKLLLVTCSLWPDESENQAAAFAARHGARRLDAPGQLLPAANTLDDHDGLFYALFQKPASRSH